MGGNQQGADAGMLYPSEKGSGWRRDRDAAPGTRRPSGLGRRVIARLLSARLRTG